MNNSKRINGRKNAAKKADTAKAGKNGYRQEIIKKLESVLANLKTILGEKRFRNRIKKASKILSNGLPKEEQAKNEAPAKPRKKVAARQKVAAVTKG